MKYKWNLVFILTLWLVVLITACSPADPTLSPLMETEIAGRISSAMTESAQTVVAEITQDALLNPSATPTETPLPTATVTATISPSPQPTSTQYVAPFVPQAFSETPTSSPTPGKWGCIVLEKSPADGTKLKPATDFDAVWVIKNSGTESWDGISVDYGYISGDDLAKSKKLYDLPSAIGPNGELRVVVDLRAPVDEGKYETTWGILSGSLTICSFKVSIEVEN